MKAYRDQDFSLQTSTNVQPEAPQHVSIWRSEFCCNEPATLLPLINLAYFIPPRFTLFTHLVGTDPLFLARVRLINTTVR